MNSSHCHTLRLDMTLRRQRCEDRRRIVVGLAYHGVAGGYVMCLAAKFFSSRMTTDDHVPGERREDAEEMLYVSTI